MGLYTIMLSYRVLLGPGFRSRFGLVAFLSLRDRARLKGLGDTCGIDSVVLGHGVLGRHRKG